MSTDLQNNTFPSRAHALKIEACERNALSDTSKKGEVTSVEERHDVQVTMSVMVQLAREVDESAPQPMTSSRDKLHMTFK